MRIKVKCPACERSHAYTVEGGGPFRLRCPCGQLIKARAPLKLGAFIMAFLTGLN
jgi:hypothetical protein